jgi:hypothetical protein
MIKIIYKKMSSYNEHPVLSLLLWMFSNPKKEEHDNEEEEEDKSIKWSQDSVQVFCSTTPPNEIFPSYRKKTNGVSTPPILRYPKM